jgi:Stage II sporulation protein E (SpoIIE)
MAYANAGHPPPFHVRRGLGTVEALSFDEGHGPALGIFDEAQYGTSYRTTAAQDLIMLFTDGLFEVEIGKQRGLHPIDRSYAPIPQDGAVSNAEFGREKAPQPRLEAGRGAEYA